MTDKEESPVRIKIITLEDEDDELSTAVGQLISSSEGKDIMKRLMKKAYYKNQLALEKGESFARIDYTFQKIKRSQIADYIEKTIVKKGVKHHIISIPKQLLIIPLNYTTEELQELRKLDEPGKIKKFFKGGIKFTALGFTSFVAFFCHA